MKTKTVRRSTVFVTVIVLLFAGFIIGANATVIRSFLQNPVGVLQGGTADSITANRLTQMLKNKKITLINVHTPYEGEIAQTDTFIPYDQIVANSASLPKDKNAPIILYCRTGRMSEEALTTVRKLGYTNVRHLTGGMEAWQKSGGKLMDLSKIEEDVTPSSGIELPISWGDLPMKLVSAGVIDQAKFMDTVKPSGADADVFKSESTGKIRITKANSQFIVDMLWAIGLAQKSVVYTDGPMGPTSPEASRGKQSYQEWVGNFASTGGWTLARGNATDYLNRFDLIRLTDAQQQKVASIAKNVYRPCCGNSTWFPDCNHGMAALAAIEMMVAANVDEQTIYRKVLALNSYWFSQTYLTTATYFARQGTSWEKVDAKEVLGEKFSSGQGAADITKKVGPLPYQPTQSGGGCGA
jgi:rhodanese-related sulfurtransferase